MNEYGELIESLCPCLCTTPLICNNRNTSVSDDQVFMNIVSLVFRRTLIHLIHETLDTQEKTNQLLEHDIGNWKSY